jgi:hypothetical protein
LATFHAIVRPMRKKLGALLGWAVTLAILAYLFHTVPFAQVIEALHSARSWTVPVIAVMVFAIYLADSFAIKKTFGWFVAPLSYGEVLLVRGATYLLALVNYSVGQGAIVYFVNRARGVPVLRGTAAVLLVMGTNLLVLLLLVSLGLLMADDLPRQLRLIVFVAYAGLAAYVAVVAWKPAWLQKRPIFDVLLSAGLIGHLKAMVVRLPHILSLVVFTYASMAAFGVVIPPAKAIFYLPIIYFVAVLPISFQGLGTSQALMILFFAPYSEALTSDGRKAAVLTASLVSQALATSLQVLIGAVCMRSNLARGLRQPPPESP